MILNPKPQVKDLDPKPKTLNPKLRIWAQILAPRRAAALDAARPPSPPVVGCGGLTWGSGGLSNNGKQNGSYFLILGLGFRVRGS